MSEGPPKAEAPSTELLEKLELTNPDIRLDELPSTPPTQEEIERFETTQPFTPLEKSDPVLEEKRKNIGRKMQMIGNIENIAITITDVDPKTLNYIGVDGFGTPVTIPKESLANFKFIS